MVIFNYTHTFTLRQLDIILTQYLQLGPYFECLKKVLGNYITRFESLPLIQRHNPDKQHPIKLPINFYKYSSTLSAKIDSDSYEGEVEYVYPLTIVIQVFNSNQFYQNLPKNIIINGLLTTTNIKIIVETLTILSETLSKLITSTLESIEQKHLVNYINSLVNNFLQEEHLNQTQNSSATHPRKLSLKDLNFIGLLFEKGLNMVAKQPNNDASSSVSQIQSANANSTVHITGIESDEEFSEAMIKQKTNSIGIRNSSKNSTILSTLINCPQMKNGSPKNVLRKFKSLMTDEKALNSAYNESSNWDDIRTSFSDEFIKKPKQFELCEYCQNIRNYLLQSTGFSYFDIQSISRIPADTFNLLKRIKSVTNVFTLYLRETNRTTIPADINTVNKVLSNINIVITDDLWQDTNLNPQIRNKNSGQKSTYFSNTLKITNESPTLLDELQPYYNSIYSYKNHDNNEYTIDELLRICLKAPQLKEIQKILAQKYMNEARVKKEGKDIETFFITRQKLNNNFNIQIQSVKGPSHTPQNYNQFLQTSSEPFVNELQLLKEYEKQQAIINRAVINCKPIYCQINQNYQQQGNIGAEIKRIKNICSAKASKNMQKSELLNKISNEAIQNQKFKMLIYQQYMRNQGFNVTKNNFLSIMNQNIMKVSKSMKSIGKQGDWPDFVMKDHIENNYSHFHPGNTIQTHTTNSLSTAHLKTEEDNHDISYDKKETQIYNKMLLNGETIRTQILNEVQYGQAVIYSSLDGFLNKLDELATENQKNLQMDQENQNSDENLFLTLCATNLKKTTSNKKTTPKNQSSLRNSKRYDLQTQKKYDDQTMQKTKFAKLHKKLSIISVQNSKEFQAKNKSNCFKKTFFDQTSKTPKQPKVKKELKFQTYTGARSSLNQSYFKIQNCNYEFKKPAWIDQHLDKVQKKSQNMSFVSKNWEQNQRFLVFQEKNLIKELLKTQQKLKMEAQQESKIKMTIRQIKEAEPNLTKSSSQIKRPMSGVNRASKSNMGTAQSLSGKKRSFILAKDLVGNSSLLATIYKENTGNNVFGCAKKLVDEQRMFQELNMNIQRSKFKGDKLMA